jgi:hypothetical protein
VIIVSSLRPADRCPECISEQQHSACKSWLRTGNDVAYFTNEPAGDCARVPCDGKPAIHLLATWCGQRSDWAAIVNADIILAPTWPAVEAALRSSGAKAAISRRWTLPPDNDPEIDEDPFEDAALIDQGLDFFAARPEVWREAARFVPKQFKLGHILWDTWMLSFFVHNFKTADLTDARVVFHPQHEHRGDQSMMRSSDSYLDMVRWPSIRIGPQVASPPAIVKTEGGGTLRT